MTPLAAYLAGQIVSRPKHREHIWRDEQNIANLRSALQGIHCFEISDCLPLFFELRHVCKGLAEPQIDSMFSTYAFLPAPKTWIEWRHGSGNRIGMLLEEMDWHPRPSSWGDGKPARCTVFFAEFAQHAGYISGSSQDLYDGQPGNTTGRFLPDWLQGSYTVNLFPALLSYCHFALVLINSPRIVGRHQHLPNAGLERRLARGFAGGSFPLHAWTEIKLQVSKPPEIDDGEPHEAHLTGRRALHFCRKHIRIKNGRLEYVSAHWRGDPSIGIKQSRYVVTP
jgi:hypothetical protein